MTKAQLPVLIGNEIAIDTYVREIRSELKGSLKSWERISEILAAAQDQFGRKSKAMRELAKKTGFSIAKTDKLIKIATNPRIKEHSNLLSCVESWTVLYEVTLLDENQFKQLKEKVESGQNVTVKLINSIRKPKAESDGVQMNTLVTISMDVNAIRTSAVELEEYEYFISTLQYLAERTPYIKVTMNDLFAKDCERQFNEISREFKRVTWEKLLREKNNFLNRVKKDYGMKYFRKRKEEIDDEVNGCFDRDDFAAAFAVVESDQFDQSKYWHEATVRVYERRKTKFAARVTNPYAFRHITMLNQSA
jgi:DNA-binding phage protein